MKNLYFITALLFGCAAELQTDLIDEDIEEILEPIGIIPNSDCRHIDMGDKPCNFRLLNHDGEVWDLYNHKGDVIVIDFSTMWCGPCQNAGYSAQPIQDEYAEDGIEFVTILIDGYMSGIEPTEAEIEEWVIGHNITSSPVLLGSREKMFDASAIEGYAISGFPTYVYIDRNMKFYNGHTGFSEDYIKQLIEQGL